MSDILAIVGPYDTDEELVEQIARRHPNRVTVLVEDAETDLGLDETSAAGAIRDRLAALLRMIEMSTGAVVVGLAGSRDQLQGWRFDRVVGGQAPLAA